MKKIYLISFTILTFISCEKDDTRIFRQLSEFERTIIPFEEKETVEFVNELSEIVTANVTARNFRTSYSPTRNWPVYELEYVDNTYIFESIEEEFFFHISKTPDDNTLFNIYFLTEMDDLIGAIDIQGCEKIEIQDLELYLIDTTVNGFDYTNVFKFEPCDDDETDDEINLVITQIIYSVENGIEFIEYEDGTYLRQITE